MPDISQLSKYLKPDACKDGDVITFVDSGKIIKKSFGQGEEKEEKDVFEVSVEIRGVLRTYSPNGTSRKLLAKAWGSNTEKWVKKTARLSIFPSPNGHDMLIAKPITDDDAGDAQEPA